MACSALIKSGLWSETAIERQMSHKERNNVRAAYIHKAEFIEERRLIMNWWSRHLEANRQGHVTPHEFANCSGATVTPLKSAKSPKRGLSPLRIAVGSCRDEPRRDGTVLATSASQGYDHKTPSVGMRQLKASD